MEDSIWSKKMELHPFNLALTVSLTILTIVWLVFSKNQRKSTPPLPPGPRGLPVLGYLPFLRPNLHLQFSDLAQAYGPIFKIWVGSKLQVVLTSPDLVREVVREQDASFANREPPVSARILTSGGLDIAWAAHGPYWRAARKLFVREMLSNLNLDACYSLRRDEVRKTLSDIYKRVETPMEIGKIAFSTELNVVMRMLWGGSPEVEKSEVEFRELFARIIDVVGIPNVSDFFPAIARFDIQGVERKMKGLKEIGEGIFDRFRNKRLELKRKEMEEGVIGERKRDFLQEGSESQISMTQIKAMLMDIVVGGTDTTATTSEWVMAEILRHPQVMIRVQQELSDAVGTDSAVEESHLPKLRYLDAVVRETFRLHPAVPLLMPRAPTRDCVVGGYTIPKGSSVFLNVWALHRDPRVWVNPTEFDPDRFLGCAGKFEYSGNNFQFLPFGSGRRVCAGIPLAEKMVMYIVASLMHSFDWRAPDGEEVDVSEKFGIMLRKRTPLIAVPTPRLSNPELYA